MKEKTAIEHKREYAEDLKRARETCESIEYLQNKYNLNSISDIRILAEILEISCKYDIPIDKMRGSNIGIVSLCGKTGNFDFYIRHSYHFSNHATDFHIDENEWYVHLSFNGCGRLNIINNAHGYNGYLYEGEFQTAWEEFIETIESYNPVQYDDINHEYFFTVPDGYKLFCDFTDILVEVKNKFKKLNEAREIEQLKKRLEELEKDNG